MKPHLQFRISIAMMVVGNIAMAMATKFRGPAVGGLFWPIVLFLVIGGLVSFIISLVRMYQAKYPPHPTKGLFFRSFRS